MPSREELKMLQTLPLDVKIRKTQMRIREWVEEFGEDGVYVSFSGGKDSTVLLDIVRNMYQKIEAVFINTGLEYPEIVEFVKQFDNVTILRPQKNFRQVLTEYGYPVISKEVSKRVKEYRVAQNKGMLEHSLAYKEFHGIRKSKRGKSFYNKRKWLFLTDAPFRISHQCCIETKERSATEYERMTGKVAIIGSLAEESMSREKNWLKFGCNAFDSRRKISNPISFWTENDILTYLFKKNLRIASVYGNITVNDLDQLQGQTNIYDCLNDYRGCKFRTTRCDRTGCMFCLFGAHLDKGVGRIERMKQTHPQRYKYVLDGGEFDELGMWIPNNKGLGFKFVIDWLNKHGNLHICY